MGSTTRRAVPRAQTCCFSALAPLAPLAPGDAFAQREFDSAVVRFKYDAQVSRAMQQAFCSFVTSHSTHLGAHFHSDLPLMYLPFLSRG